MKIEDLQNPFEQPQTVTLKDPETGEDATFVVVAAIPRGTWFLNSSGKALLVLEHVIDKKDDAQ
jgi:hypothetical protein